MKAPVSNLELFEEARNGPLSVDGARALADIPDTARLMVHAAQVRDDGHGDIVTYSPKVFIPLTQLCRNVCHYCFFARTPRRLVSPYLSLEQVVDIARAGERAGCHEALFTLGDRPEYRYQAARDALASLGHKTTISYVIEAASAVLAETGLLPHVNAGVLSKQEILDLRRVSASQGLMLESTSKRICERGGAHYGSPDKIPARRLDTLRRAGEAAVPYTTGILIGIGETRRERIDDLLAIRELHARYGHIQEVIVQNFRAKPGTKMANAPEPAMEDLAWTIAVARLILGPGMSIQAPPNLASGKLARLIHAGINDWGGVSPVTADHVNPEAPWPHLQRLRAETASTGKTLVPRLTIYSAYGLAADTWLDPAMQSAVLRRADSTALAREDDWVAGSIDSADAGGRGSREPLTGASNIRARHVRITSMIDRMCEGQRPDEDQVVELFSARGDAFHEVCRMADELRAEVCGNSATYVVTRNINYTNMCYFRCGFCAFSKGSRRSSQRETPYNLTHEEIVRRVEEAWRRGATEVCMQGGIHPAYTGQTYIDIVQSVKAQCPNIHVHAFSPLEIWQGARSLGLSVREFLIALRAAGLSSLPGTAAEVLDDEVRDVICPDKLNTREWLQVIETAHEVGLRTTSTIMFGHIDRPIHWARHLLRLRDLQERTGGITEFVPLPFIHMAAPMYTRGHARKGPTLREALLMHAVARLVLHPYIRNIQTSWVKMGALQAVACLRAGANDLGGTLMNESISRAAGTEHGQEMPPERMDELARLAGRTPSQRTTLYGPPNRAQVEASYRADPLFENLCN